MARGGTYGRVKEDPLEDEDADDARDDAGCESLLGRDDDLRGAEGDEVRTRTSELQRQPAGGSGAYRGHGAPSRALPAQPTQPAVRVLVLLRAGDGVRLQVVDEAASDGTSASAGLQGPLECLGAVQQARECV